MTPELKKIKAHYLNPVEKEFYESLSEIMDNADTKQFFFTNGNLKTLFKNNKIKVAKENLAALSKKVETNSSAQCHRTHHLPV